VTPAIQPVLVRNSCTLVGPSTAILLDATNVQYDLSNHSTSTVTSSLMDGGTNGGMTGSDVHVIPTSDFHKANVAGTGETTVNDLPLVTTAGFVNTRYGSAIISLHQYAHYVKGHTIHSGGQLYEFGNQVD
jgi:hypothetical protein